MTPFLVLLLEIEFVLMGCLFQALHVWGEWGDHDNMHAIEVMLYHYSLVYYLVQENIVVKNKNTFFQRRRVKLGDTKFYTLSSKEE